MSKTIHTFDVSVTTSRPLPVQELGRLIKATETFLDFATSFNEVSMTSRNQPVFDTTGIPDEIVAAFLWCIRKAGESCDLDENTSADVAALAYHWFTKSGFVIGEVDPAHMPKQHSLPRSGFRVVGGKDLEGSDDPAA